MKLITTSKYISSSADNKGFQQMPTITGGTNAIEFTNGLVMTFDACFSFLVNNKLITWYDKKAIQTKSIEVKFLKISQFESKFFTI